MRRRRLRSFTQVHISDGSRVARKYFKLCRSHPRNTFCAAMWQRPKELTGITAAGRNLIRKNKKNVYLKIKKKWQVILSLKKLWSAPDILIMSYYFWCVRLALKKNRGHISGWMYNEITALNFKMQFYTEKKMRNRRLKHDL